MKQDELRTSLRKPPGRPRNSAGTAELLVRAALDLFAGQNYASVTIKDIAQATGVNASLIYYYFGSKEGLFLEVVESTALRAFESFDAIRKDGISPEETVSLWIENHILQFPLMQKLIKISIDYATTHDRSARIDLAIRKFYDIEAKVLGEALRDGIARGVFAPVDVDHMTTFISTFLDGVLVRAVMFPAFDARSAIQDLRGFVLAQLVMAK
ncbi:MAG TPA: TetR/AcrR family transcriptional regulator [Acetobacteraceae bacterium]|nr:TetR/AcrR family transcriptional regulator [Acetobacteraceae bacterium]